MTETERLAVVTGAPSGIGFAQAKAFAANGFDLLINVEAAYRWRAALGSGE